YSDPKAWDSRYSNDLSPYEWFADWPLIKSVVREYISHKCNILHIGCGTSNLGDHLISDGYKEVVNIDASETVIQSRTNSKHCTCKYQRVDVRQMDVFATSEFDAIIDKGTIDSLMVGTSVVGTSILLRVFRESDP
ncbi:putative methylase, partial [Gregarina niphandrodes]